MILEWILNHSFYCPECKRFLPRTRVRRDQWDEDFKCMWCGSSVRQLGDTMDAMLQDYTEFLIREDEKAEDEMLRKYKEGVLKEHGCKKAENRTDEADGTI